MAPKIFIATKRKGVSNNEQSWFMSVVLDGVLGPSRLAQMHLVASWILCSSESNARGESRALEGRRVSLKNPSRVRVGDEGVVGRNRRESICLP